MATPLLHTREGERRHLLHVPAAMKEFVRMMVGGKKKVRGVAAKRLHASRVISNARE